MEMTALEPDLTQWIRGETNRPELRYHVANIDAKKHSMVSVLANLARELENGYFEPESRGIIFVTDQTMAKALNKEMGCFVHFSGQERINTINISQWKDGHRTDSERQPWIAATPGLINGIDVGRVDAVLFGEEGMAGLFGGVQGTGRGGRAGVPCMCILVTSGTFSPPIRNPDYTCMKEMKVWTGKRMCRRIVPSEVMDDKKITCPELLVNFSNTQFCDVCKPDTNITQMIKRAIDAAKAPLHITPCVDLAVPVATDFGDKIFHVRIGDMYGKTPSKSAPLSKSLSSTISSSSSSSRSESKGHRNTLEFARQKVTNTPSIGMAVRVNAAMAQDILDIKRRKADVLNRVIEATRNYCYVCWLLRGEMKPAHNIGAVIYECGLTWGMGWQSFKKLYMTGLEKYHFCWSCGLPQSVNNRSIAPEAHKGFGKTCNVENMTVLMIFAIKRHPEAWRVTSAHFKLDIALGDEDFAEWVGQYKKDTENFYNGLELVIWFIQTYRFAN